jgi:hypothetical protein
MQGYVLSYRPDTGRGTLVTESGKAVRFSPGSRDAGFQGGDVVGFQMDSSGATGEGDCARDVVLLQKWVDRLTAMHRPLVLELHTTLEFAEPAAGVSAGQ